MFVPRNATGRRESPNAANTLIKRDSTDIAPGRFGRTVAVCPAGSTLLGGGFQFSFFDREFTKMVGSLPVAFAGSPKPNAWSAEAFPDLAEDVRQSIARIKASPFIPHKDAIAGFIFDVATGKLNPVS